jgi:pimeloyl-ACP methyl ester carboxylesterase
MGAILAKEFALRFPDLVKRVYAIGYPLQESPEKLETAIRRDPFMAMYLDENPIAKVACQSKVIYKYFLMPFGLLFYRKRFLSFWHYFSHTYKSSSNSIKNTVLRDEYESVAGIADKMVFIAGADDHHVDATLLPNFQHKVIPNMGHIFFGFEEEIADIVKAYEEDND